MAFRYIASLFQNRTRITIDENFPLNELHLDLINLIFEYVSREDIITLTLVSKRLSKRAKMSMYRAIHILLVCPIGEYRVDMTNYYINEALQSHVQRQAPPGPYPSANTFERRKNIRLPRGRKRLSKLISLIKTNPEIANMIVFFTVEVLGTNDPSWYDLQFDMNSLLRRYYDENIMDMLTDPALLFSGYMGNCKHISLPICLIPIEKSQYQFGTNLSSLTLYAGPICGDLYHNKKYNTKALEVGNWPAVGNYGYHHSVDPKARIHHSRKRHMWKLESKLFDYKENTRAVIANAERLANFLHICAINPNISTVHFYGFEMYNKYCAFLSKIVSNDVINTIEYDDLLRNTKAEHLQSLRSFATRLSYNGNSQVPNSDSEGDPIKMTNPLDNISASNTEVDFLEKGANYGFSDFFEFISRYVPKKGLLKIKNLTVHASHEGLIETEFTYNMLTRFIEFPRENTMEFEVETADKLLYRPDYHQKFMKDLFNLKIDEEYVERLEYTWRLKRRRDIRGHGVAFNPYGRKPNTKSGIKSKITLSENFQYRSIGKSYEEEKRVYDMIMGAEEIIGHKKGQDFYTCQEDSSSCKAWWLCFVGSDKPPDLPADYVCEHFGPRPLEYWR